LKDIIMKKASHHHLNDLHRQWVFRTQTDEELGGPLLGQKLSVARSVLKRYGTKSLHLFLEQSRFGSHPELIRLLWRIGSEKAGGKNAASKSTGQLFYPGFNP
jgi:hypothetical protein